MKRKRNWIHIFEEMIISVLLIAITIMVILLLQSCHCDLRASEQVRPERKSAPVNNEIHSASFASFASFARNLDDVHAASCRVVCTRAGSRTGSIGTGTVVLMAEDKYWILTNWHVVQGWTTYRLDFFRDGKIKSVSAKLEKSWYNERVPYDFAVLTVKRDLLQDYNPPIVPLGGSGVKPFLDRPIFSAGCSEGRWSMAWKGFVENYFGPMAQFYPAPKSGQSGSAIVQEINGRLCVTGILTFRVGDSRSIGEDQMRGGAIPISHFYAAATGRTPAMHKTSIPPHSAFCLASGQMDQEQPPVTTRVWPVMDSARYYDPNPRAYDDLILFVFCIRKCKPCDIAKPIIKKLQDENYNIEIIQADDQGNGSQTAKDCNVSVFPTFLLCRDTKKEYKMLESWSGVEFCESRIRQVFAKHANTSQSDPPEVSLVDQTSELTKEEIARRRRIRRSPDSPAPDFRKAPAVPSPGSIPESNGGNGDVSPLLNEPDQPGQAPITPLPAAPDKNNKPETKPKGDTDTKAPPKAEPNRNLFVPRRSDTEQKNEEPTAMIDRITAPLTSRIDGLVAGLEKKATEKLDTITADLSAKAETIAREKIDELKPGIIRQLRDFIGSVIWRAALFITVIWYGYYLLLRLLGALLKLLKHFVNKLPRIRFERKPS